MEVKILKKNKSSPLRLWILNPTFCSFFKSKEGLCVEIEIDEKMLKEINKHEKNN